MIYFIHIIRNIIKFIKFPIQFIKLFNSDLNKDKTFFLKKITTKNILVLGPPKSGTTLIEWTLGKIGYVNMAKSTPRIFDDRNLKNVHDLSSNMLKMIPKDKPTFLKRHSEATSHNLDLIKKYDFKTIIIFRDLKDIMISRYLHMLTDKKLPQYKIYSKLDLIEGFKVSLIRNHLGTVPIQEINNWMKNWENEIKKKDNIYCLMDYDDFTKDKFSFFSNILNFIDVKDKKLVQELIEEHEKHSIQISKNTLHQNLNKLDPQTYNRTRSAQVKKILENESLDIFFEDCYKKYC